MAWRGIHLSRPAYLAAERGSMRIEFRDADGGQFRIPLEDLSYLIIDTPEVALSSTLMARLAADGVMIVGSNERHLPCWTSLPWTRYHRPGDVLPLQLEASLPTRKRAWAHIVERKLFAQATCLTLTGAAGADEIHAMRGQIRSGDPDNVEARAARRYWPCLFGRRNFRRHDDDLPNAMLNYGYAILRAGLARLLCATGFIPQLGLHHRSQTNAYNLADDLLEPYRPFVDHLVVGVLGNQPSTDQFTTDHRRALALIMETEVVVDDELYGMLDAMEITVGSLKAALAQREARHLKFPGFHTQP